MRRLIAVTLGFAVLSPGCGETHKSENTGVPLELNKSKNAPGSYGDPNSGANTAPPPKK